jgi:hypothetical protein
VKGSLVGGSANDAGSIETQNFLGNVSIGGDIRGGSATSTGLIGQDGSSPAGAPRPNISVGGSLVGGNGTQFAGAIMYDSLGQVKVAGSVIGADGQDSGYIHGGSIAGVSIGQALVGGSSLDSGEISADARLGPVQIGGDLLGGTDNNTGYIMADHIDRVTIGGSIVAGSASAPGSLTGSGWIQAGHDIGSIAIGGSLMGTVNNPVVISAVGQKTLAPHAMMDVAIGSLTVRGGVELANILAGYDTTTNGLTNGSGPITGAVNGKASILLVKVGGDWVQSNLVAGATPGADNQFGDTDDAEIGGPDTPEDLIARIAAIVIQGQVAATPSTVNATDHYAFVAEDIGALSVGKTAFALKVKESNDVLSVGSTGDVMLVEMP